MDTDSSSPFPKVSPDDKDQSGRPLSNCILMLFESQILTDVTFLCKDQDTEDPDERIHAHKNILAARSPVFRAMFTGSYKDGEKEIYLSDIEGKDFRVFLRSIYSDELSSEVDSLVQTLKIAHKYQINYVVDRCFTQLSENLTTENACSLLDLALFYGNEEVTTSASRYIDAHSEDILRSEGFLEISLQCLTFVLKGDTFFTDETKIFERSMEWAEKRCNSSDGTILRQTLGDAFFYLRTPAMTMTEFISCTKRKGYYTLQETEDIMEAIVKKDDGECANILSNYRISRILPKIDIQIPESKFYVFKYVLQATARLTLKPAVDIFLTNIKFSDLQKGSVRNPAPNFGMNFQTSGTNYQKYDMHGRQIKATVTIEEIGIFQEYIVTVQKNPLCIELHSPVLLQGSKDKYSLKIEIKPVNMSFIQLAVQQVQTVEANSLDDITDDSGKITIRCDYDSTCHAIVDTLTFQHLSHRKD